MFITSAMVKESHLELTGQLVCPIQKGVRQSRVPMLSKKWNVPKQGRMRLSIDSAPTHIKERQTERHKEHQLSGILFSYPFKQSRKP